MTAFADGFVAYHIEVEAREGQAAAVARSIKGWEAAFRTQGTWPDFPQSMERQLRALGGVTNVVCEGPQSSLLIPLRMVRAVSGARCEISAVLGTGPVTQAIDANLARWGIDAADGRRLEEADSPIEISVREPGGRHESVRLYPASRSSYRSRLKQPESLPEQLLLNRFNEGIAALARAVAQNGGLVSFRPRELGRHDKIEDYLGLLPSTHNLILSSRHQVLRQFARAAGVQAPRKWPATPDDLVDPTASAVARWLLARMPEGGIVVLVRYPESDTAFFREGLDAVAVPAPGGYGTESRAARIQGALLIDMMRRDGTKSPLQDQPTWYAGARAIVEAAFRGTESRPWQYL